MKKLKQSGQVILILLLVMTIGLGVGLSIISRNLTDISTSTKVEQSSRAFGAAEAGIERALNGNLTGVNFTDNQSLANVTDSGLIPGPGQALEYPPISKEDTAHFWLANPCPNPPSCSGQSPSIYYNQTQLDVYWGKPGLSDNDKAAIEITLIYLSGGIYQSRKFFFDPIPRSNGFTDPQTLPNSNCLNPIIASTAFGANRPFYCKVRLSSLPGILQVARIRLLYTGVSQPVALAPLGTCGVACSMPPQARVITSTGISGDTQRTVQLFKLDKVVPFYFDYALFSAGDITK